MLLLMKNDIMFELVTDFSLWSHIKEKDDTVVHGKGMCPLNDMYCSYIF